uniref:Uncharacterized protein n=1 Tax=Tetraselmis sp. GSL018 TaxID=582737 RepID=A0A061R3X0_9CHLO|eukprot:CAMPEP_0177599714 /NCGR_PEP_ID=MMETSP0419_2-20121207/13155_1 /TAXON_ID=582737 /ORGANISM="Tetraselmis sp., Strain GSL018" /LENGTH=251 /DNA_ID=CAMNT_0019092495 /DNA_START=9 /DNA_END=764 /DNA_ORIENTATION=+
MISEKILSPVAVYKCLLSPARAIPRLRRDSGRKLAVESSRGRRKFSFTVSASVKSQEYLDEGKALVVAGNRMGAIKSFEDALEQAPTQEQRQAALYNITCCHASFGDVELAQITLREALLAGLDFDAALENQEYVPFTASKQARIQLKKFADSFRQSMAKASARAAASPPTAAAAAAPERRKTVQEILDTKDVGGMTSTELKGIDSSVGGIVLRVAGLLLALIGIGVTAYLLGLEYILSAPEVEEFDIEGL